MASTWKNKLKGSFDLVFLFGRGIKPFEDDNNKKAGLQSLWVLAVLFPFTLASALFWPPEDLVTASKLQILVTFICEVPVGIFISFLVTWLAAMALDRRDRFWIVFQAGNWVNIPLSIVGIPFVLLGLAGWYPRPIINNIATVLTCYTFIVSACIYYRGFKTNWELAGFLACFGYVIGKAIQDVADSLNGVPHL